MMKLYKYHGAGNDFLLYDVREDGAVFSPAQVASLCDRHLGIGSDGLMVLSEAPGYDFRMDFFNPDGSGGMMCGNGGRCIVAFARDLGIAPAADGSYRFLAPDGPHTAFLLSDDGLVKTVRLGMKSVSDFHPVDIQPSEISGWFVDTGTRHFVTFVPSVADVDVEQVGREIRHLPEFGPVGVNVNFVEIIAPGEIAVRTFEKGVEGETLACGTGITASAIAAWLEKMAPCVLSGRNDGEKPVPETVLVHARRHDLTVAFTPNRPFDFPILMDPVPLPAHAVHFRDVTLTGPAERVAEVLIPSLRPE